MMKRTIRMGWIACVCAVLAAALTVGCSLYANDRAYLNDAQYGVARQMYLQTGSLDLVKRQLQDMEWRRSSINEAVYRLQKEFEVLPEEIPAQAASAAPAAPAMGATGTTSLTLPAEPESGGQPITLNPSAAAPGTTSSTGALPLPPPPAK